jgi:phosphate-selective porin OprO/OprP
MDSQKRTSRPLALAGALALGGFLAAAPAAVRAEDAAPAAPAATPAAEPAPAVLVTAAAQPNPLEDRVKQLEATVRELQDALRKSQAAPPAKEQVEKIVDDKLKKQKPVAGWDNSFFLQSPDAANKLRIRGYLQSDARAFTSDSGRTGIDTFSMRRIRPIFEGTVAKYWDFKLMADFAAGADLIQDAYVDFRYWPQASLLAGKYKEPVSLERLQSATNLLFIERSIANNLQPNRDVGVQLHGELAKGRVSYVAGAFNGVNDGRSGDVDTGNDKDFAGRIFLQPFKTQAKSPLQGLGVGLGASIGAETDTLTNVTYRTGARSAFFKYAAGVTGDGSRVRLSPQFYYFRGPLGLMGEYVSSSEEAKKGGTTADLRNRGYFIQGSYVVTGEKASYTGVVPRKAFDPGQHHWGAFELGARYSRVDIDDDAFSLGLADPKASAGGARELTLGLNWYFNRQVKLQLNYVRTDFDRKITFGPSKLDHEDVFLSRFQVAF